MMPTGTAGYCFVPYVAWVTLASTLSWGIYLMNPRFDAPAARAAAEAWRTAERGKRVAAAAAKPAKVE